jgi:hypothetical protein
MDGTVLRDVYVQRCWLHSSTNTNHIGRDISTTELADLEARTDGDAGVQWEIYIMQP